MNLKPGIHTLTYQERLQRYALSIPAGYSGDSPVPLVVALHWGGVVTPFYSQSFLEGLILPALSELGALIVAPDCQHSVWTNPHSESEVLALIEHLNKSFNIDTDQIALTGYSKGGMGVWYLAARNQETFSAAIPVAGMPQPDSLKVDWRIPLYVIHSWSDEVVPIHPTVGAVKELQGRGVAVELVTLEGLPHYQTDGYIPHLRQVVPWLWKVWMRQ